MSENKRSEGGGKMQQQLNWRIRKPGKEERKMDGGGWTKDGETRLICLCFQAALKLQDFLDQPTVEVNFSPSLSRLTHSPPPALCLCLTPFLSPSFF